MPRDPMPPTPSFPGGEPAAAALPVDPVCGMTVSARVPHRVTYAGREYHFCSAGCRLAFEQAPGRYVWHPPGPAGSPAASAAAGQPSRNDGMAPLVRPAPAPAMPVSRDPAPRPLHARPRRVSDYVPLAILVALAALAAAALEAGDPLGGSAEGWMHRFMGLFLVFFALFKLVDLRGFADGFRRYDLLAQPFRPYAYAYPFVELALGLGYLAAWRLPLVYGATLVVMLFGALGVARALRRGLDLDCACLGTALKVPLSTVALTENLAMATMAAAMWVAR